MRIIVILMLFSFSVAAQNYDNRKIKKYPDSYTSVNCLIVLGQSNAEGIGDTIDLPLYARGVKDSIQVLTNDDKLFESYKVGNHYYRQTAGGGTGGFHGVELPLSLKYNQTTGDSIYLLKVALSGRPLFYLPGEIDWNVQKSTTGDLYVDVLLESHKAFLAQLYEQKKKPHFVGVVWFQGESDVGIAERENVYLDNLTDLFYAIRNKLNLNDRVPFVICKIGSGAATIQVSQQTYCDTYDNTFCVETVGVGYNRPDGTHLDSASFFNLAEAIFSIFQNY